MRSQHGIALVVATMAMMLLSALGAALILVTSSETAIAANFRRGGEALYAATAVAERAIAELRHQGDWNSVLAGVSQSTFIDGASAGTRRLTDGTMLDLASIANLRNCSRRTVCTDTAMNANTISRPWGINNPRWTLYAHGTLDAMAGAPEQDSPFYVVAMVADDGSENDGDPRRDGAVTAAAINPGRDVVLVRGEAFGPRGSHRAVEAVVHRYRMDEFDPTSPVRVQLWAWREF